MSATELKGAILGMGNPLLDISADTTDEFLTKYELKLNNAILADEKHQSLYAEMIKTFPVQYIAGGATQNSIRVAQWMLQTPGATSFIGCVGQDEYANQLRTAATGDNVAVYYLEDEKVPTGTCACLIKDKERSLVANLSAANNYKLEHLLTPAVTQVWQAAKIFYIAGFFLTVSPPSLMHIANHAHESGKTLCMNISAPFIAQFFTDPLMEAMPYVDILFGNESEAEELGKKQGYPDKSVSAIAQELAKLPKKNAARPRVVVITQGSKSTCVATASGVQEIPTPALAASEIVDSNGAGDAFVGGFLSQLALGKPIEQCVHAGHYSAGVILKVSGTVLSGTPNFVPPS